MSTTLVEELHDKIDTRLAGLTLERERLEQARGILTSPMRSPSGRALHALHQAGPVGVGSALVKIRQNPGVSSRKLKISPQAIAHLKLADMIVRDGAGWTVIK